MLTCAAACRSIYMTLCAVIVMSVRPCLVSRDPIGRGVYAERRAQHLWRRTASKMPFG